MNIIHMIGADEILAKKIDRILAEFLETPEIWKATKKLQLIHFGISAYDNDPRALLDIPEVRDWAKHLHSECPYILSVIDADTLRWFLPCVAEIEIVARSSGATNWRLKSEATGPFMDSLQKATHRFYSLLASTQEEYDELTTEFFTRLNFAVSSEETEVDRFLRVRNLEGQPE